MPVSDGYVELLKDLLSEFAPVTARRMFSGVGLYSDGVMFAIVIDDVLHLKADEATRRAFEAEGLAPFTYVRSGRAVALSYWRAPERLLDDRDEMHDWAGRALSVARQTSTGASRRNSKRRKAP